MKANKYLTMSLAAAGVAIAGAVIFFTSTKKGKNTMSKLGAKGKQMSDEVKEIVSDAKRKIKDLKKEMLRDCAVAKPETDVLQS
jgi:hypothetical protein